ncbi:hypothetical protein EVAR_76991_1 [Eumeta japonica]|uniref:Uncharacterized protein n=1 Tax=Eumeta variegata TaxID=151549 RepID=A0A4C1SFA9_EUMVA|nr:hypothetical protein EVAR_76991_1 [Eumeta japonica]
MVLRGLCSVCFYGKGGTGRKKRWESVDIYEAVLKSLGLDAIIITFHEGECTMEDFINKYSTEDDVNNFKVADFDPDEVFSWLVSTSGSTGVPKVAAFTGRVVFNAMMFYMKLLSNQKRRHVPAAVAGPVDVQLLDNTQWTPNKDYGFEDFGDGDERAYYRYDK